MLSSLTQTTIALLQDISAGIYLQATNFSLSEEEYSLLLNQLVTHNLIRPTTAKPDNPSAIYELCRQLTDISLLDILEATGEPLNCGHHIPEEFYFQNQRAARKLGVLNDMTRMFCADIKLSDW